MSSEDIIAQTMNNITQKRVKKREKKLELSEKGKKEIDRASIEVEKETEVDPPKLTGKKRGKKGKGKTETPVELVNEAEAISEEQEEKECMVCMSPYTLKLRIPIVCLYCKFECCKQCLRQFELTKSQPQCMKCNAIWSEEFLEQHFSRGWVDGDLRVHLDQVLLEQEKSMIVQAIQEIYRRDMIARRTNLQEQFNTVNNRVENYRYQLNGSKRSLEHAINTAEKYPATVRPLYIQRQIDTSRQQVAMQEARFKEAEASLERLMKTIEEFNNQNDEKLEVNAITIRCPKEACKGFLTSKYYCPVCYNHYCRECHICLGKTLPEPGSDGSHKCDPELVNTIKLIVRDTKPCPSCKMPIFKLEGCNQMFCTNCNTGFNWATGEIEKGRIHNPHYFEWMQKTGGKRANSTNAAPIEEGRGRGDCRLTITDLTTLIEKKSMNKPIPMDHKGMIFKGLRLLWHIEETIATHPLPTHTTRHLELRVKYVSSKGGMTEEDWKKQLSVDDRAYRINFKHRQVQETLMYVLQDIFQRYRSEEDYSDCYDDLMTVVKYYNDNCRTLATRHNRRYYRGIALTTFEEDDLPVVEEEAPSNYEEIINDYLLSSSERESIVKLKTRVLLINDPSTPPSWMDEEEIQYFKIVMYFFNLFYENTGQEEEGRRWCKPRYYDWDYIQRYSANADINCRLICFEDMISKRIASYHKRRTNVLLCIGAKIYHYINAIWNRYMIDMLNCISTVAECTHIPSPKGIMTCGWLVPIFSNVLFPSVICGEELSMNTFDNVNAESSKLIFRNFYEDKDRNYQHLFMNSRGTNNSSEYCRYDAIMNLYFEELLSNIDEYRKRLTTSQLWKTIYQRIRNWLLPHVSRKRIYSNTERVDKLLRQIYEELKNDPKYTRKCLLEKENFRIRAAIGI